MEQCCTRRKQGEILALHTRPTKRTIEMSSPLSNGHSTTAYDVATRLSSVACFSAAELGDILRGRAGDFPYLHMLITILSERVGTNSAAARLVDPSSAVILHRAIDDSGFGEPALHTIDALVVKASEILDVLGRIARSPNEADHTEVERFRDFCLNLSRNARAREEAAYSPRMARPSAIK